MARSISDDTKGRRSTHRVYSKRQKDNVTLSKRTDTFPRHLSLLTLQNKQYGLILTQTFEPNSACYNV